MAMVFLQAHVEYAGSIETVVCAADRSAEEPILEWLAAFDHVRPMTAKSEVEWADSAVVGIAGEHRMVPLSSVLLGGKP